MLRDLRHAAASLWRSPIFSLSAVAALGLAIGANATIFGVVDGLWFRPPGIKDPGRLLWVFSTTPEQQDGAWSFPEYRSLRDGTAASLSGVVARGRRGTTMPAADGSAELLLVNVVSTNFFSALGVPAAYGRLFDPGDEASLEQTPVVVLGNAFWRRRFGGDPAIVGRSVALSRSGSVAVVVAAVLPETFREIGASADRDIWMPPQTWARLENRATFERLEDRWFDVLAIRGPGVTTATAQAEVQARAAQLAAASPATNAGRSARVISHFEYRLEQGGASAAALLGLVLLVVMITCVNVANLLFARGVARARELAVRSALGATRRRLLRELLIESLVLGAAGAMAGLTLALWLIRLVPSLLIAPPGLRSFTIFQADARVLVFTLSVTLVTTILFGIAPSWFAARTDVAPLIKAGSPGAGGGRPGGRIGRTLAVAQIAVSLVLLAGAAALARSFLEIRRADIGVSSPQVLSAWVSGGDTVPSRMPETRLALERLAALPGVTDAAVAIRAPMSLSGGGLSKPVIFGDRVIAPGAAPPSIKFNAVSREYFKTLGVRLIAGRLFELPDEGNGEPVVIVNQEFVQRFYPGGGAIGAHLRPGDPQQPEHRIVGIVQNAAINDITEKPEPYFYLPFWRGTYGEATFLVQAKVEAATLAPAVRDALRGTSPALDPRRLITMREYIDYSGSAYRATATLAGALGVIGLLLTVLGVYGVIAYRTTRRGREIGIRMALGANRRDVLALVLREGAIVAGLGVAIGIPAAIAGTREMASLLFHVTPSDPLVIGGTAALLFACVGAAALLPAWRATRIEPADSLRAT